MKYKADDRVRIKSLDWYNENKNEDGDIECSKNIWFYREMSKFCGKIMTISHVRADHYTMVEDLVGYWTDEMIEGLVEEEDKETSWKPSKEEMDVLYGLAYITNKYDEHKEEVIARLYQDLKREFFNGSSYENMFPNTENDVRRRSTIQVLEYARSLDNYNQYGKADIDKNIAWLEKQGKSVLEARTNNELVEEEAVHNKWTGLKVELELSKSVIGVSNVESLYGERIMAGFVKAIIPPEGYIFKDENGNVINATKIVLEKKNKYPKTYEECVKVLLDRASARNDIGYKGELLVALQKLLVCRDAYWEIAGEKMGLRKPWEPDWNDRDRKKYCIFNDSGSIRKGIKYFANSILAFPTDEMRDAFYENFKELIEICKELL